MIISKMFLLHDYIKQRPYSKSVCLFPLSIASVILVIPPTSNNVNINTAVIPANIMNVCKVSVQITAFMPP